MVNTCIWEESLLPIIHFFPAASWAMRNVSWIIIVQASQIFWNIISLGLDSPTLCPKGPTSEKTKGKRRRRCRVGAFILLVKVELPSTDYYCLVFNGIRFHRVLSFKELLKKVREKKKHSIDKSPVVSSRCQCFFSDMMLGMTFCFLDFI